MSYDFSNIVRIFRRDYLLTSLTLVAITIPLSIFICNVFIILSLVLWLFTLKGNTFALSTQDRTFLVLFSSVYALQLVSLVNTGNFYEGWNRVESKLPYLIFPLIVFFSDLSKQKIHIIFWAFTLVILFVSSTCLALGFMDMANHPNDVHPFDRIQYTALLAPFGLLQTYFSIYLSFIIFYLFLQVQEPPSLRMKILLWILISYLSIVNMLMLSRAGLIAFFITILIYYLISLFGSKSLSWGSIFLGLFAGIIFIFSLFYIPNFKNRFDSMWISFEQSLKEDKNESALLHVKSWYCAAKLSSDYHFFTGYGTGDEGISLAHCYENHHWKNMTFNAHNEYLSNLVRHGVVGLIIFSISLFWPLWLSFQRNDFLYISFILLFSISLMTVSLDLQHGVVFYSLFNALLFKRMKSNKLETVNTFQPLKTNG